MVAGGGVSGAALLAASLGSCSAGRGKPSAGPTTHQPSATPTPTPTPLPPDPDAPVLAAAADAEQRLLTAYAETVARHPSLKAKLAPFVGRHEHHLEALRSASDPSSASAASVAATTTPSDTPDGTPASGASNVPATPAVAVTALVSAERDAAADRDTDVLRLRGPEHARLLASIGACEATHATALGQSGAA